MCFGGSISSTKNCSTYRHFVSRAAVARDVERVGGGHDARPRVDVELAARARRAGRDAVLDLPVGRVGVVVVHSAQPLHRRPCDTTNPS